MCKAVIGGKKYVIVSFGLTTESKVPASNSNVCSDTAVFFIFFLSFLFFWWISFFLSFSTKSLPLICLYQKQNKRNKANHPNPFPHKAKAPTFLNFISLRHDILFFSSEQLLSLCPTLHSEHPFFTPTDKREKIFKQRRNYESKFGLLCFVTATTAITQRRKKNTQKNKNKIVPVFSEEEEEEVIGWGSWRAPAGWLRRLQGGFLEPKLWCWTFPTRITPLLIVTWSLPAWLPSPLFFVLPMK